MNFAFSFLFFFQWVTERFVIANVLVLNKFCIIILNLSFFSLTIIKHLLIDFYRILEFLATNIKKRGKC